MSAPVEDLPYEDYTARQFRELEPDQLLKRALTLEPSGHYRREGNGWTAQPYPGFAVVSMMSGEPTNEVLPGILVSVQAALWEHCPWREALYFLPASSFHQTVANTLSEERFLRNVAEPGLEREYVRRVGEVFKRIRVRVPAEEPIPMRLIGLSIFGTAMGVLGIFDDMESYQLILRFRSAFYGDPVLQPFGVRRTRPFIGHVTLAYIESVLTATQREDLAAAAHRLNQSLFREPPYFYLAPAELRRYDNLSEFRREDHFPSYSL